MTVHGIDQVQAVSPPLASVAPLQAPSLEPGDGHDGSRHDGRLFAKTYRAETHGVCDHFDSFAFAILSFAFGT